MQTVLLVVHLLIAIALVGTVLLQRSEGGGLGMGGGGGGFMTGRATANLLTRATGLLAAGFFITSITLAILADQGRTTGGSIMDAAPAASSQPIAPAEPKGPSAPLAK